MSQSRFSIVLVGVSALLRRPLVSRLRPADGERSSWVVFAARGCRFDSGFRSASWSSGSPLPLFGMHQFGVAAGRVRSSAFRFGNCRSAGWFFRLPLRSCRWAGWPSDSLLPLFGTHRFGDCRRASWCFPFRFGDCPRRVGLRAHCFRFSACTDSGLPLGELVLPPSVSEFALGGLAFGLPLRKLPLGGLAFGLIASAFRHAPHRRLPLGELVLPPSASEIALGGLVLPLGGLAFGLIASAFRHAPFRRFRWASSFFRLPLRKLPSAGWPSGSPLLLFGMRRFGDGRWAGWPSDSLLPLFGMHRFGNCPRRVGSFAFRFGVALGE